MGKWILTNRIQSVVANGVKGPESKVLSGVPQGTVLGPILFPIMIQSLGDLKLSATLASFADDSKIMKPITNMEDVSEMQNI